MFTPVRGQRILALAAVGTLTIGLAACSADTTEAPAADAVPVEFDANGRPILDDAFSAHVAAAADITVDTSEFATEGPYRIAAIVQGPTNGWGTAFDATMYDAFEQSGKVEDILYVPWEFATENQVKGVEDAIAADVDAIMLTSLSRAGLVSAVERATAAGIPVVTCLAGVESEAYTAEVTGDLPVMGFSTADEIAEQLGGSGKVVMLHGIAGADAAEFWKSGAHAAFGQYPGIEIVSEQYANWSAAEAIDVMRTVIAQHPDVDAVWVGGLEMGPAVISAFQEAGVDIPLMGGTNPTNGFLRLALENELKFTVAPFTPAGAATCAQTVLDILEGKPVAKYTDIATVIDGAATYNQADAEKWYVPEFNDDFSGPIVTDREVYLKAGFGK